MIAKIMKSSKSFTAVYYNEHKVSEQKAALLAAENFDVHTLNGKALSQSDYIRYFKEIADQNTRVRSKQFHAIISTKETMHSAEDLKLIAEAYVQRMGYGENPYLLYFHADTDHNHVHIVSSRVNKVGEKINDSFEKRESLRHIQHIMQAFNRKELGNRTAINDVLQYQFTTEAQLKLLLERKGFLLKSDTQRNIIISLDNKVVGTINRAEIDAKLLATQKARQIAPNYSRKQQLSAILLKYRNENALTEFMKEKFGVELVFHYAEGKTTPYGYTLIDHANKQVFKGSEILKLYELLNNKENTILKMAFAESPHIENLRRQSADKNSVEAYLIANDLFVFKKDAHIILVDRPNNETHNVTDLVFLAAHAFIDLKDTEKIENTLTPSQEFAFSIENILDTDRKRKKSKGIKR